ncbi:MAG: GNAT family N-acetyltransferase [Acidobacteria bacterium]|nr:GNAT family N-acetyltransferase [Acidobacteriota bacterium]
MPSFADYNQDILLRDGALLRMRALQREDRTALEELFQRCSPDSIRFRFLFPLKALSNDMLNLLTDVNDTSRVALAVLHGTGADERIVAVGRYFAQEKRPHVAEVSFLVEDAWQRRGIGSRLLDALADIARTHGITRFAADVLADNRTMLSVFRKAGYALSATTSYGVTHLEFPIAYNEIAAARQAAQEAEVERVTLPPQFEPVPD